MAETELDKAFSTLAEAFMLATSEITEEMKVVVEQIEQLKERIVELNNKQQTLAHDRESIAEMYKRYCNNSPGKTVEF